VTVHFCLLPYVTLGFTKLKKKKIHRQLFHTEVSKLGNLTEEGCDRN